MGSETPVNCSRCGRAPTVSGGTSTHYSLLGRNGTTVWYFQTDWMVTCNCFAIATTRSEAVRRWNMLNAGDYQISEWLEANAAEGHAKVHERESEQYAAEQARFDDLVREAVL